MHKLDVGFLPFTKFSQTFEALIIKVFILQLDRCHWICSGNLSLIAVFICLYKRCLTWMGPSASGLARPEVEMVISSFPAELQ